MNKLLLALCLTAPIYAAPDCTAISDTLYPPGSSSPRLMAGTIDVTRSYSTPPTVQGTARITVSAGIVSVCLQPGNYIAAYSVNNVAPLAGKTSYTRYWSVPSTVSTLKVGDVETSTPATPSLEIAASQITPGASGYVLTSNGTSTVWGAAASGGVWGSITGTLTNQTDLVSALAAKQNSLGYTPLNAASNLSDLANAGTARTNLGLGTVATRAAPTGTIVGDSDTQTLTNKTVDGVTPTVFGYIDATSSIQTQLNAKASSSASTTVSGQTCALGGSCTITAAGVTNALDTSTTRAANTVYAGPTTGAAAAPTFRALVAADLPTITSLGTVTTGVWNGTKIGLAYGGTNADLSATGGTSQVLKQATLGGNVTVGQLAASDLSNGVSGTGAVVLATGNAATSTALAANGTNCSAGNYPLGVDASGNAENCTAVPTVPANTTATSNNFFTAYNSTTGAFTKAQPACSSLSNAAASCATDTTNASNITSGTLPTAQDPALTGDVTKSAGSSTTTLANIPNDAPMAGDVLATASAAPATPAAGKGRVYVDSTSKALAVKNDAGTVSHTVQTKASAANNFLTAIADDGTVSAAQPSCSNLSDASAMCNSASASSLSSGTVALARGGTGADLSATGGTSQVLKQTSVGGAVSVARLACADLSDASATCATSGLNASNISSGTLAAARGGAGTVNGILKADGAGNVSAAAAGTDYAAANASTTVNGTTCALSSTCAPGPQPFSQGASKGAIVTAAFTSATPGLLAPGSFNSACTSASTSANYWHLSGYFTGVAIATRGANSIGTIRANVNPDCYGSANNPWPGGVIVPPLAALGGFSDSSGFAFHQTGGYNSGLGWTIGNFAMTPPTVNTVTARFIDDGGLKATPISTGGAFTQSASVTAYWGLFGQCGGCGLSYGISTENQVGVPMPVAGTIKELSVCTNGTTPTNNITSTLRKNAVDQTPTVTTSTSDAVRGCRVDTSDSFSVAAGDIVDIKMVTGAGTVPNFPWIGTYFYPSSGSTTVIGGIIGATVSTTANYGLPGTAVTSSTQDNQASVMPGAYTCSNLYVVQSTANGGGVTTTFTLQRYTGGAWTDTAITGTITNGSGTGSIAVDTTHTATFAAGDRFTLKYVTGSGTSGTIGGWAMGCS